MKSPEQIPGTMKAVFLQNPGGPLTVKEVSIPVPGPGEVLIKMAASPINPSDLARIRHAHIENDLATFIPGLEGSGTVVASGSGLVPSLWMGKRVACSSKYPTSGTWAEYMVTNAGMSSPLFKKISFEQGSMSLVNPLTALAFIEIARKKKHKAIINNAAASALGRMLELLCKESGIPLVNLVRKEEQVNLLTAAGSQYVLNSSGESFLDELKSLSHQLKATLLFDSVCSRQLKDMMDVLPPGGEVVIYGNLTGAEEILINPGSLIGNDKRVSGFFLGTHLKGHSLIRNMLDLMKVGRLMKGEMKINVRQRYPLSGVNDAIESYLADMTAGKVLLVMS